MNPLQTHLTTLGACSEAIEWAGAYISLRAAWDTCERSDWLLWYASRRGVDRNLVVLAACACARTAIPYAPAGDDRPRIAIETTEAWTRGDATLADVRAAAYAAASSAAYASAAASSAAAAYAASSASAAAAYAAAQRKAHRTMCSLVRDLIP